MRKYIVSVLILSLLGAAISLILLFLHYHPEIKSVYFFGKDFVTSSHLLSLSGFFELLGLPFYVLSLYLFIFFTAVISNYAARKYYLYGVIVSFLPAGILVISSLTLLFILTKSDVFYIFLSVINLLLLLCLSLWLKKIKETYDSGLIRVLKKSISGNGDDSDKKAAFALFLLCVILLLFSAIAFSSILKLSTNRPLTRNEKINSYVEKFYKLPVEDLNFPDSAVAIGNPYARVHIIAFNDFLCSACYEFYKIEKHLLVKYKDQIRISYYNYPLDKNVNKYISKTAYVNSGSAALGVLAAARENILPEYLSAHFDDYENIYDNYSLKTALKHSAKLIDNSKFVNRLNDPSLKKIIMRDIEIAHTLKIKATPTIFINGRRVVGFPPEDVFEIIIEKELSNASERCMSK